MPQRQKSVTRSIQDVLTYYRNFGCLREVCQVRQQIKVGMGGTMVTTVQFSTEKICAHQLLPVLALQAQYLRTSGIFSWLFVSTDTHKCSFWTCKMDVRLKPLKTSKERHCTMRLGFLQWQWKLFIPIMCNMNLQLWVQYRVS